MSLKSSLSGLGSTALNTVMNTVMSVGRSALHSILPDDFEYYLCSLELVNCKGERKGFLSFSVMPEQIVETHTPIQTMIKTHEAVVTVFNDSFAPVDISISGTFGRRLRLLLNYKDPRFSEGDNVSQGRQFLNLNFGKIAGVEAGVKTGYGMTKVLEHILLKSAVTDRDGKPYYLKFCNYSLNTAYIVDVVTYNFNQNMGNNMMWNYSMTLRAVAPLPAFDTMKNKLKSSLSQVAANAIASGVTDIATGMIGL